MNNNFSCPQKRGTVGFVALLAAVAIVGVVASGSSPGPAEKPAPAHESIVLEAWGRTQCVPKRKAILAPAAPPHPVTEVLVALGDRVKKSQPLIKLDDDEAQAELRAKQANWESAEAVLTEAKCRLEASAKGHVKGAVSEEHYHDIRTAAIKAEKDVQAAKAAHEGAKAELEHFLLTAPIDGVVDRLDVYPGTVARPGTAVWGEILDLSEIDVRCDLSTDQADQLTGQQGADVRVNGTRNFSGEGKVVFIGLSADKATGLVPVLVRLPNAEGRLRCGIAVQVRFTRKN
jgi:membrane fusion protein (multidrug efflux system)